MCDRIIEITLDVIRKRKEPTEDFVHDLVENELAYINTRHHDFYPIAIEIMSSADIEMLNDVILVENGTTLRFESANNVRNLSDSCTRCFKIT